MNLPLSNLFHLRNWSDVKTLSGIPSLTLGQESENVFEQSWPLIMFTRCLSYLD